MDAERHFTIHDSHPQQRFQMLIVSGQRNLDVPYLFNLKLLRKCTNKAVPNLYKVPGTMPDIS